MSFEDLLRNVREKMCQDRKLEANYMEVVVDQTQIDPVTTALQEYFGLPFKPAGKEASPEAAQYSKPYGGIAQNQTMYYRRKETVLEAALLWPWGSGAATTVKIFREGK